MFSQRSGERPSHPLLAAVLDVAMGSLDEVRARVVPLARGRVLEIGAGTGLNLPHYRDVDVLAAIEPDPFMMRRARQRAKEMGAPVLLVEATGERLPYADATFDDVVLTFTLCMVQEPTRTLLEVKRVLKSGGRLLWAEHVRARGTGAQRLQDALTPAWRRCSGNCHLNRDAHRAIEEAGFVVDSEDTAGRQSWTLTPIVHGIAHKP